jgi:hypothetical protein
LAGNCLCDESEEKKEGWGGKSAEKLGELKKVSKEKALEIPESSESSKKLRKAFGLRKSFRIIEASP